MRIFFTLLSMIINFFIPVIVFYVIFRLTRRGVGREKKSSNRRNSTQRSTQYNNFETAYTQQRSVQRQPNRNRQTIAQRQRHYGQKNATRQSISEKEKKPGRFSGNMPFGKSFFNSDFDTYTSYSERQSSARYTTGYDKDYSHGGSNFRKSLQMQYSHTYDGHEPWDDCLPKEKDPWDKNFRT